MQLKIPDEIQYGEMFLVKEEPHGNPLRQREYLMVRSSHSPNICSIVAIVEEKLDGEASNPEVQFLTKNFNSPFFNINFQEFVTGTSKRDEVEFKSMQRVEPHDKELLKIFAWWVRREVIDRDTLEGSLDDILADMRADANLNREFSDELKTQVMQSNELTFKGEKDFRTAK